MKNNFLKEYTIDIVAALFMLLMFALCVSAQTVIAPKVVTFSHADVDYNVTASYTEEFFQCASVTTAGVCQGEAAAPFQAGNAVPKSIITGPATARTYALGSVPGNPIPAFPAGVPFVMRMKAVGDPNVGGEGESARSGASNPFFASGRIPAAPTNNRVQ